MKIFLVYFCFLTTWISIEGLQCWTCTNAKTNKECIENGKLLKCQLNENACHNEVRRGDKDILITKRCKQDWACTNNAIQNPKAAWAPSQCNSKVPSSVCRCCCTKNGCNKYGLNCIKGESDVSTCKPLRTPRFGRQNCKFVERANEIGTICNFRCNEGYILVGRPTSQCELKPDAKNFVRYNNRAPKCAKKRKECEVQTAPRNGRMTCTNENKNGSVCTFECTDEGFQLNPRYASNLCLPNFVWSRPKPCCARKCPPFTVVDFVIAIDSSSSIGDDNWKTIKSFVRELINTFEIGEDAARIGVFRYNKYIDTRHQILLGDFPNDKAALFRAFDAIPYFGKGTYTGKAMRHAERVMFAEENGNRPDVPDYLLIITDGRSQDTISSVSRRIHRDGVHVLAVGVVPPRHKLDLDQLNEIVNHKEDLILAKSGFADLNLELFRSLVQNICRPGCI